MPCLPGFFRCNTAVRHRNWQFSITEDIIYHVGRLCSIISLLLLVPGCARTAVVLPVEYKQAEHTGTAGTDHIVPDLHRASFHVKKKLVYGLAWNGIPVGYVTVESGDISRYEGTEVYNLKLVAESNKFLSRIYRVEDTYISYIDVRTMSSLRHEADRKEGRYRKHIIVEYDTENLEAVYTSLTNGSVNKSPITKYPQDPLSAVCYFMTCPLKTGETVNITVNLNEKNYDVDVSIGEKQMVRVPAFDERLCFKATPRVELGGKEVTKGRAWGYVSADSDRYPVYGVVRIPFGKVTATLVKVENI
jgi:hypothetical protein